MLKKLAWAAAQGTKQALQGPLPTTGAAATAGLSPQLIANACINTWRQTWVSQKHSLRQLHASHAPAFSNGAKVEPHSILEHAAQEQMKKMLKAKAQEATYEAPTVGSRIFGAVIDAVALAAGGLVVFGGYYTFAYPEVSELDKQLDEAYKSLEAAPAPAPALAPSAPGSPAAGGAAAVPKPPPPAVKAQGTPIPPAAFPPLTTAWCSVMERYLGLRKYVEKSIKDYRDPTCDKLLPDMAPELRGRIKTLVLDLDDTLVHKEWTRQSGWKIYKRPGVQDFLLEMGGYYEVVLFTDATATYADPIISKLDPHRAVMYRLYRPETQYHNGKHVRDLSKLNRDLSQVLMISAKPEAWEFQPENTLKLKEWTGDTSDTTLLDLIPMLQLIATKGVHDVRDVVRSYDGEEDVGAAFKARMAQIAAQQKQPKQKGLLGWK